MFIRINSIYSGEHFVESSHILSLKREEGCAYTELNMSNASPLYASETPKQIIELIEQTNIEFNNRITNGMAKQFIQENEKHLTKRKEKQND